MPEGAAAVPGGELIHAVWRSALEEAKASLAKLASLRDAAAKEMKAGEEECAAVPAGTARAAAAGKAAAGAMAGIQASESVEIAVAAAIRKVHAFTHARCPSVCRHAQAQVQGARGQRG